MTGTKMSKIETEMQKEDQINSAILQYLFNKLGSTPLIWAKFEKLKINTCNSL